MNNPKNPAWYTGGMGMDMAPGAGSVFYCYGVDGGIGDNANDGLTPETPVLTLTYAISLCTADADDYIIVLNHWQPTGEAWPIVADVGKLHIIGADGAGTKYPIIAPTGDTAAIQVAADRVELARLAFHGGATHGCVESDAAGSNWGTKIRDCWFSVTGASQDGYRNVATCDDVYLSITRCRFGFAITRDGVRIEHNATRSSIGSAWGPGNLFDRVQGVAVNAVGNTSEVGVYNNLFAIPANTAGAAVTLSAGSANALVMGNTANFGDTDMGNNPYLDSAGAGASTWANNYQGITLTQPA